MPLGFLLLYHNEIIFFLYIVCVSIFSIIALKRGEQALVSLLCVQIILANLFVTKEITLFGLSATASDALAVGASFILNLIQEYFGSFNIHKTIWTSFFISLFYILVSLLHIAYSGDNSAMNDCFATLLNPMPRILLASLVTYLIVQHLECWLYNYLSCKLERQFFILRNYSSVAITQLLDTILFSFLGLYKATASYNSINTIIQIIIVSYSIKLVIILLTAPFIAFSKKLIKL